MIDRGRGFSFVLKAKTTIAWIVARKKIKLPLRASSRRKLMPNDKLQMIRRARRGFLVLQSMAREPVMKPMMPVMWIASSSLMHLQI